MSLGDFGLRPKLFGSSADIDYLLRAHRQNLNVGAVNVYEKKIYWVEIRNGQATLQIFALVGHLPCIYPFLLKEIRACACQKPH